MLSLKKIFMQSSFLKIQRIKRGKGLISQYILFENKYLFSIYLLRWDTGSENISQNRFHSHAFNSICFRLSGEYQEEVVTKNGSFITKTNPFFRIIKRNHVHRIVSAKPKSFSLVLAGPWDQHWWEFFPLSAKWVKYQWGRIELLKQKQNPYKTL